MEEDIISKYTKYRKVTFNNWIRSVRIENGYEAHFLEMKAGNVVYFLLHYYVLISLLKPTITLLAVLS